MSCTRQKLPGRSSIEILSGRACIPVSAFVDEDIPSRGFTLDRRLGQ